MWSIKLPQCETPHYPLPLPINKLNFTQSWRITQKIIQNETNKIYDAISYWWPLLWSRIGHKNYQ